MLFTYANELKSQVEISCVSKGYLVYCGIAVVLHFSLSEDMLSYHAVSVLRSIVEKGMYCIGDLTLLYLNENSNLKVPLFLKMCIICGILDWN